MVLDRPIALGPLRFKFSRIKIAQGNLVGPGQPRTLVLSEAARQIVKAEAGGRAELRLGDLSHRRDFLDVRDACHAIVALADMNSLELEADIGESNVSQLRTGQPAQVSVQAFPERNYRAELRQIIPTADRTKATITVRVTILGKDRDLKPEMSARVTFLEAHKDGAPASRKALISVPKDAIAMRDGKSVVFEVNSDQRISQIPIITSGENQDQVLEFPPGLRS